MDDAGNANRGLKFTSHALSAVAILQLTEEMQLRNPRHLTIRGNQARTQHIAIGAWKRNKTGLLGRAADLYEWRFPAPQRLPCAVLPVVHMRVHR